MNLLANCITGPSFIQVFLLLLWEGPLHFFQIIIKLREKKRTYSARQVERVLRRLKEAGLIEKTDDDHWDICVPAFRCLRSEVATSEVSRGDL